MGICMKGGKGSDYQDNLSDFQEVAVSVGAILRRCRKETYHDMEKKLLDFDSACNGGDTHVPRLVCCAE